MKIQKDWDDAYANMAHVEGSDQLPEQWTHYAKSYRDKLSDKQLRVDIPYGSAAREIMDMVLPDEPVKGLAVFVHGGYWMRLDKSYWTHLAEGARARGWAVCFPSYTLTPDVTISHITTQITKAISTAASRVDGPIRLAGHSAGGHLVSRMICADTKLDKATLERVEHTLSISGLHDLRPLLYTKMNEVLGLTEQEARAESAALQRPVESQTITSWVGGGERPEFIRQAKVLAMMWEGFNANTQCIIDGEHNHFTLIDALEQPDSPMTSAFIGNR